MWLQPSHLSGLWLPEACMHLFELTTHKPHNRAHPLTVHAHFKSPANTVNNPISETPQDTHWGSHHKAHSFSLQHQALCVCSTVFTRSAAGACQRTRLLKSVQLHLLLLSVCLVRARKISAVFILLRLRIAWPVLPFIVLHLHSPNTHTHTHMHTNNKNYTVDFSHPNWLMAFSRPWPSSACKHFINIIALTSAVKLVLEGKQHLYFKAYYHHLVVTYGNRHIHL